MAWGPRMCCSPRGRPLRSGATLTSISISGYDAKAGVWRVVWMMPYSGEFTCMVSRQVGDEIIQEGFIDGRQLARAMDVFGDHR